MSVPAADGTGSGATVEVVVLVELVVELVVLVVDVVVEVLVVVAATVVLVVLVVLVLSAALVDGSDGAAVTTWVVVAESAADSVAHPENTSPRASATTGAPGRRGDRIET